MDLVLLGGNVLTMDGKDSRTEAVAVNGGKLEVVGSNAEVSRLVGPDTEVVHLAGRTVIPGFVDPHNHFSLTTFQPVSVNCSVPPHNSLQGVLESLAAAAKDTPRGRWIWGWGFRSRGKESLQINRWELDEVSPNNPVCIMDGSVHAIYANSAALKLAGIDRDTPESPRGRILRADNGEPNGTLWEGAMDIVHNLSMRDHMDYLGEEVADLVRHNCMKHLAMGITSVGDSLVLPDAAEMYRITDAQGKLPFLVHQMLGGDGFFAAPQKPARREVDDGNVSDRLRGGTVKMFMDPVFPKPALMHFHPDGGEERLGERYYTQEEADALVLDAHSRNLQVAIHCLGTWSVEQALNAFEAAQRQHPREEPRFRIEHFFLPTMAQIRRAKSLGVVASIQPQFVYTNAGRSKVAAEECGGDVRVFPFKTMISEGVVVAASSDAPCAPLNPMVGLQAIVTRVPQEGGDPVVPEEAVTPVEALRMYTINSAYAMNRESEVGSLEKGKRADMAVLSHDLSAVDPEFIQEVMVERTYVDGQLVYER